MVALGPVEETSLKVGGEIDKRFCFLPLLGQTVIFITLIHVNMGVREIHNSFDAPSKYIP